MNAPANISAVAAKPPSGTPATLADVAGRGGQLDRQAKLLADVAAAHGAFGNLLAALTRSGGLWSTSALRANLAAVEAVQQIWADTLEDEADNTAADLPDRGQEREFSPSFVHPDDPCQSKGAL